MGSTEGYRWPITFLIMYFMTGALCQTSEEVSNQAVEAGVRNHISLYSVLYEAVFPRREDIFGGNYAVSDRFILQSPGKLLHPRDFIPGTVYEKAQADPTELHPETNIPYHINLNWYRLSDVLPTYNPFGGGATMGSFREAYGNILADLTPVPKGELDRSIIDRYDNALIKLNDKRPDPDALFIRNITILDLYNRYRIQYYQRQLFMDNTIFQMQGKLPTPEFNAWYTINYPLLEAQVDEALYKWRQYGEKENVETYLDDLNTAPGEKDLEAARVAYQVALSHYLEATHVITTIRTEPTFWYRYLLPGYVDKYYVYSYIHIHTYIHIHVHTYW